jgi:hypothetical protein
MKNENKGCGKCCGSHHGGWDMVVDEEEVMDMAVAEED